MNLVKLRAIRPLNGDRYFYSNGIPIIRRPGEGPSVRDGDEFYTPDDVALDLESRGLAERPREASVVNRILSRLNGSTYETKVITPDVHSFIPVVPAPVIQEQRASEPPVTVAHTQPEIIARRRGRPPKAR